MQDAAANSTCHPLVVLLLCAGCLGAAAVLVSAAGAAVGLLVAGSPLPTAVETQSRTSKHKQRALCNYK
jgi:hypothetical protein